MPNFAVTGLLTSCVVTIFSLFAFGRSPAPAHSCFAPNTALGRPEVGEAQAAPQD
jgi:hypothetical protein